MPKFISKKQLEICNNLAWDLKFNQSLNPALFKYLPNTYFHIVFSMPHDDYIRTRIEFPISKELRKKFPKYKKTHFELNMDFTWEDFEDLPETDVLQKINESFNRMSKEVKRRLN